jgi:uncharacterized iron-regulated protein
MRRTWLLLSSALAFACAGSAPRAPATKPVVHSPPPRRASVAPDAVARAGTPFYGLRTTDGARLEQGALLEEIARADLICAGENHDDAAHHFVQLSILEHLVLRAPQTSRQLGVGLEMIPRTSQGILDAFARGAVDEGNFLRDVDWDSIWGFDFAYYRPILDAARRAGATLLALNAPRSVVRAVARGRLKSLSSEERRTLPELRLDDAEHRGAFDRAMAGHPKHGMSLDHLYAAQVLWDETMAAAGVAWLDEGRAPRQLLVLAGTGHCHESAIVRRVERRIDVDAISVRTVASDAAAEPDLPRVDYVVVLDTRVATTEPSHKR